MILDFHAHIMPGLDHGCTNIETSLCQLKLAKKANVDIVVATSHFYPHKEAVETFLRRRQTSWKILRRALTPDLPKVFLGAETLLFEGMEHMDGITELCLGDKKVLLLEMPFLTWKNGLYDSVEKILRMTETTVLAHVERYNAKSIEILFEMGALGQINVESLTNIFKRRDLMKWIDEDRIVALGSDIHGTADNYRKFAKAHKILGEKFDDIMSSSLQLLTGAVKI